MLYLLLLGHLGPNLFSSLVGPSVEPLHAKGQDNVEDGYAEEGLVAAAVGWFVVFAVDVACGH